MHTVLEHLYSSSCSTTVQYQVFVSRVNMRNGPFYDTCTVYEYLIRSYNRGRCPAYEPFPGMTNSVFRSALLLILHVIPIVKHHCPTRRIYCSAPHHHTLILWQTPDCRRLSLEQFGLITDQLFFYKGTRRLILPFYKMEFDNRSVPLAKEPEIAPIRTDDPEYYWTALVVLVILSVVIMILLYNHDIQDPGYSHWRRKMFLWKGNGGPFHFHIDRRPWLIGSGSMKSRPLVQSWTGILSSGYSPQMEHGDSDVASSAPLFTPLVQEYLGGTMYYSIAYSEYLSSE